MKAKNSRVENYIQISDDNSFHENSGCESLNSKSISYSNSIVDEDDVRTIEHPIDVNQVDQSKRGCCFGNIAILIGQILGLDISQGKESVDVGIRSAVIKQYVL